MDSTRFLRKFNKLVHYDKPHNSLPFILMMIIAALAIINSCMVVIAEKENLEKCLLGMKDIAAITTLFSGIVERGLKPRKAMKLVELIENDFFISGSDCFHNFKLNGGKWKKFEIYYNKKRKDMKRLWNKLSTVIILVYVAAVCRNLFNDLLLRKTTEGLIEKSKDWPTPFVYWCPAGFDSFGFFTFIFSFQALLLAFVAIEAFCIQLSVCLATERVLADFETIYMLLKDLADEFSYELDDDWGLIDKGESYKNGDGRTDLLKKDMGRIVACHQELNRNFKDCAQNSAYVILITSCGMTVDTCVNIYIMLKADDLQTSFNYALACFFINLIVFFSYHTGQRIVNQNEILRRSLTDIAWIDKPHWFKQSLHIMMARANVDTEMKPYGIYVLNYMSFKNIMKAALSFGHFLYTVNRGDFVYPGVTLSHLAEKDSN